jgi:hypothetical protein
MPYFWSLQILTIPRRRAGLSSWNHPNDGAEQGRLLVTAYTERSDSIRIISARKATRRERKIYAEEI